MCCKKGYFTVEEFNGFMTHSKRADAASSFFTEERWAELDVRADNKVEFEEFVYAFSKWVSADDEDVDDDDDANTNRVKNELTPRITLALQLAKAKMTNNNKDVNFMRIIMRFPKIHKVFNRIKSIHDKYDLNKDGKVQLQEMQKAVQELMNTVDDTDTDNLKQLENIFMLSDLDHHGMNKGLDVKEFIIFCAVGFILDEVGGKSSKQQPTAEDPENKEYRQAMMDIAYSYLAFDKEGKGYFTSDDMHRATSGVSGKKDASNLLTPERWSEMDIDYSGRIDFEEFVYAFSTWVTAGDDEE